MKSPRLRYDDAVTILSGLYPQEIMGKLVLFVLLALAGWLLFKGFSKKPNDGESRPGTRDREEQMVKCDLCGVFMPESDSAQLDGKRSCKTPQRCLHRQSA